MPDRAPREAEISYLKTKIRILPDAAQNRGNFSVVAIGASAGGLEACRKLVTALPADTGMALILVQHLDPTHDSMLVDLLTSHTPLTVLQATDRMLIEREHLYVIPPGTYLAVGSGVLHLSQPQARHGERLPFDFLLQSLAKEYGTRAICIILSGTGADGSLGLKAVKENAGLVIAQDPAEAEYDGMPRSAIATGAVDLVLPVAKIAETLAHGDLRSADMDDDPVPPDKAQDWLPAIIDLLRAKTAHDFTLYKQGTLARRIKRRMAMAATGPDDADRYLSILRHDANELDCLAKDLLINVTSFFRDPKVFDFLEKTIIPDLLQSREPDQPLRIWIAGCSTGEETYSIAILFCEAIAAAKRRVKLQVFASDVDPDAVARARDGLYPETIEAEVSPGRLARFFSKENHGYRISPELRAVVVFAVQDVLADPPFSRLDLVSCRNLLIYLRPEAQARVISFFHFALRQRGILLLGSSETISNADDRFEVIAKNERLYRRVGRRRPGELGFSMGAGDGARAPARAEQGGAPSRQAALAELCRRLVMEAYAPAAVLINHKQECLFSLGPTERFLHVAPGYSTHNLLAMVRQDLRTKLRSAIQQASQENARVIIPGSRIKHEDDTPLFRIDVRPVPLEDETLLLICFAEEPKHLQKAGRAIKRRDLPQVAALEQELEATRTELQGAIHNLEISSDNQKAINEEALSVNEEYQITNEELLTSKEELQSLNEELTALNTQLQETLERQRTTSDDLQNVLYSTDIATLFLDTDLNIRFFTPATKFLFRIIPSDVGRPLADFSSLASDTALPADAQEVLRSLTPIEREIETQSGVWFIRRILPYRTHGDGVEGVVITFNDITERKHTAKALEAAKQQAELANAAKSRFLAAASHDLRQPLQTLALLQGLLAKAAEGAKAQNLVARLDETLSAMSGMLNTLLDINQIDAGIVQAEIVSFPINDLLDRLRDEFTYVAQAQGLALRIIPCGLSVRSDPGLLEQIIRNLLSNALKYTRQGKVLIGCRRHEGMLSVEIWDTGIGIPEKDLRTIFGEYHQLDNAARERSRGLGLGLSIVQRLADLLGHRVQVRSSPGKGSMFAIGVAASSSDAKASGERPAPHDDAVIKAARHTGTILVVEDDLELRELLELTLKEEGHQTAAAADGSAALDLAARGMIHPDIILADYNLPSGMNGLEFTVKLREMLHREIPVIILTGDISTGTLRDIALHDCVQLNKPVRLQEMTQAIDRLLATISASGPHPAEPARTSGSPVVFLVDDDRHIREDMRTVLEENGHIVEDYANCETFLEAYNSHSGAEACLLIDAYLPGMGGMELLQRLQHNDKFLPAIMITGNSDVQMAIQAMKAGASDFIEKPIGSSELLAAVERALEASRDSSKLIKWQEAASSNVARLTLRERQIMELVLAGHPSKNIAADLGISQRTVENHRASIMKKTGSKSLPALARLALAAAGNDAGDPLA